MQAPEKLKIDEYHSEYFDQIDELREKSFSSFDANTGFTKAIESFFKKLREEYSLEQLTSIPELEKLRGGGEGPYPNVDAETKRLILQELSEFLDEARITLDTLGKK